jgi:hypothetical protein
MEQCIIDNKICPASNLRCKVCKLAECENVQEMLDKMKKQEQDKRINLLRLQLPEKCSNCSFINITKVNADDYVAYCPYMAKNCEIK